MKKDHPPPPLDVELSDLLAVEEWLKIRQEFINMPKAQLDVTPYQMVKCQCAVERCPNGYRFRDYGISPYYYRGRRWWDLTRYFFYCGKHYNYRDHREALRPGPALAHIIQISNYVETKK